MLKIRNVIACDFLNQIFINATDNSTLPCIVQIQNFRCLSVSQVTLGLAVRPVFLLHLVLWWGDIVSVETGLCWWGVCLFLLTGTVCLSGDRADCHLAPYVMRRMFTPELSGSIFPVDDNDDSVPHCELSPWIAARLACLSRSGEKPILFCQWVQELSHVHPEIPLSRDLTR